MILERVASHLATELAGYDVKYYRWSDADLRGDAAVALLGYAGTDGEVIQAVQSVDVRLSLLVSPASVKTGETDILAIQQALRTDYDGAGYWNITPIGSYSGPIMLQNGRAVWELVMRVGVEDY